MDVQELLTIKNRPLIDMSEGNETPNTPNYQPTRILPEKRCRRTTLRPPGKIIRRNGYPHVVRL
jgi:hypothetical protein